MAIRLIRANNSGEVTAYDDAVVFYSAKGHDYTKDKRGGVFDRVYQGFGHIVDNVSYKFIIKSGMGMLYGRQFELPENETIEFTTGGHINEFITYYVELEVKLVDGKEQTRIELKAQYSSESYPSLGNVDLIVNRTGTATMELYRVKTDGSGRVASVEDRRYIYIPGHAEKARMMDGEGIINGRKVKNLVFPDKDLVRHADHAYHADRASALGASGISTVKNSIDDDLYMKGRDSYLVTAKEFIVLAEGTTISKNNGFTKSIMLPSSQVIGALVYGTTNLNFSGFYQSTGGGLPLIRVESEYPNKVRGWKVTIDIYRDRVEITNQDIDVEGSLVISVLMLGTKE